MKQRPRIGISVCFFHADPKRPIFTGKTLQYVEQSIVHWVQSAGALALVIPSPEGQTKRGDVTLHDYASTARRSGAARWIRCMAGQLRRGAAEAGMERRPRAG